MLIKKNNLGVIIKRFRNEKGYTQDELAEMVGVGQRQIASYEAGKGKPSYKILESMIRLLGIPADMLFRPETMSHSPEQEQAINEFLSCDPEEQRIIAATMRCMIREMRKRAKA